MLQCTTSKNVPPDRDDSSMYPQRSRAAHMMNVIGHANTIRRIPESLKAQEGEKMHQEKLTIMRAFLVFLELYELR